MAITYAYTLLRVQKMGTEQIMDWQVTATGTYTTGGDAFTPAQLGLDVIDFISIMYDGSGANTNGVALVAPNLTSNLWQLFGTGTATTDPFNEIGSGQTMTGFQFIARCYGVA